MSNKKQGTSVLVKLPSIMKNLKIEGKSYSAVELILIMKEYWNTNFKTRDKVKSEQQRILWDKASAVLREVVSYSESDEPETVFSKMVSLCILLSGLGSSTSQPVIKETYPALHSVLKVSDLASFAELPIGEKQQQMLELAQIVMGIRLFNKDCLKGGAGIDDLPAILTRAVDITKNRVNESEALLMNSCEKLSSTLFSIYDLSNVKPFHIEPSIPDGYSAADLELLKAAVCFARQYQLYIRELCSETLQAKLHIETVVDQLRTTLLQLHETVRYRSAIPTIQVYPLFVQLSVVWRELQNETASLSQINQLIEGLESISEDLPCPVLETISFPLRDNRKCNVRYNLRRSSSNSSGPRLRGFCPWTLVQTNGGLLPGLYSDKGYCFRSIDALEAWWRDPEASCKELYKVVKNLPYLHKFLGVKMDSDNQICGDMETTPEVEKPLKQDAQMQTEVHPISSNIDPSYAWNEWELKRRALRLAKLTNCATRSQQTTLSKFRADKITQTSEKIDKMV